MTVNCAGENKFGTSWWNHRPTKFIGYLCSHTPLKKFVQHITANFILIIGMESTNYKYPCYTIFSSLLIFLSLRSLDTSFSFSLRVPPFAWNDPNYRLAVNTARFQVRATLFSVISLLAADGKGRRLGGDRVIPTNQRLISTAYQLTSPYEYVSMDRHWPSYNERAVLTF
jgi:hypothetical protein